MDDTVGFSIEPRAFAEPPRYPEMRFAAPLSRQRSARPMTPLMRVLIWVVLGWAIVSGCFVTDLFVCPWTAVFRWSP